jgi:hypothetical protein
MVFSLLSVIVEIEVVVELEIVDAVLDVLSLPAIFFDGRSGKLSRPRAMLRRFRIDSGVLFKSAVSGLSVVIISFLRVSA